MVRDTNQGEGTIHLSCVSILLSTVNDKNNPQQNQFENEKRESTTPSYQQPSVEPTSPYDDSLSQVQQALEQKQASEEAAISQKLKAQAKRDWPNDYSPKEYWINQELEDYRYMKTVPNDAIKRQAQRDWPLDFTTQKYWYGEQIEAKQRLGE